MTLDTATPDETWPRLRHSKDANGWEVIHLDLPDKPDVSRLAAPTFAMRVGLSVVQIGGIAGVGTDDAYRNRGYASLVLEEATRYFTETNHDVAILFGIPDFYHRFGYAPVLPVTTLRVAVADADATRVPAREGAYTSRPARPTDWRRINEHHFQNNLYRTGVMLHPGDFGGYRHGTQWRCGTETFVVCSKSRTVVGYVVFDDVAEVCRVGDLGTFEPDVFPALLDTIVAAARRRQVDEFEAKLPPDHPFVHYCRRCGGRVETAYDLNAGGMGRIINLRSLIIKLGDVLATRLAHSPLENFSGQTEIATDIGTVTLEWIRGAPRLLPDGKHQASDWRVTIPQMRLMQLVMGYRSVDDVSLEPDVHIPGQARQLLDIFFPVGNPWMPLPDWF